MYSLKWLQRISGAVNVIFALDQAQWLKSHLHKSGWCAAHHNTHLLQDKAEFICFPMLIKSQTWTTQYMCLLVNNSRSTFSIYGVKHAVEHSMHKTSDDTPLFPTPEQDIFPTIPMRCDTLDFGSLDLGIIRGEEYNDSSSGWERPTCSGNWSVTKCQAKV